MARRRSRDLHSLIEEALTDAYGDEQPGAFLVALSDGVEVPFMARALGVNVRVEGFDTAPGSEIAVALCRIGRRKHRVLLTEIEWDPPGPKGVEWIEAYKTWISGDV